MCAAAGAGLELSLRRQPFDPYQSPTLQLQQLRLAGRHHETVVVALPDIQAQRQSQQGLDINGRVSG
jgi:hypothetical protein